MTLDEAILHAEEVAIGQEEDANEWKYTIERYRDKSYCAPFTIPTCQKEIEKCKKCSDEHRQLAAWLRELKAFKEKEKPKAVRYEGDGKFYGTRIYDKAFCPSCDRWLEDANWKYEFCPKCGQRLRWEEEVEE